MLASSAIAAPRIGDPAPALALEGLDGKKVDLLPGKPAIVDFFATWCEPCHAAVRALTRILGDAGLDVQLVLVDVREEPEVVAAWFAAHPLPRGGRVALDRDAAASIRWGHTRYPTTFLVDDKGIVRHINRGFGPGYEERLRGWARAMGWKPPSP